MELKTAIELPHRLHDPIAVAHKRRHDGKAAATIFIACAGCETNDADNDKTSSLVLKDKPAGIAVAGPSAGAPPTRAASGVTKAANSRVISARSGSTDHNEERGEEDDGEWNIDCSGHTWPFHHY